MSLCVSHTEDALAGHHEEDENNVEHQKYGDYSKHHHRLHVQGHAAEIADVAVEHAPNTTTSADSAEYMMMILGKHDTFVSKPSR